MAAPYNPPVKNEEFIIRVALEDCASPGSFKANPTLADGDITVSTDTGAFGNVSAYSVSPAASISVLITLSAAQMNGDSIMIKCVDQTAPKEWCDLAIAIATTSA